MTDHSRNTTAVENKCTSCGHNTGGTVMNCEYACAGVEKIADDGSTVISCNDYKLRANDKKTSDK